MSLSGLAAPLVALIAFLAFAPVSRAEPVPIQQDPLGPLSDVTNRWTEFQPAEAFCVRVDGFDLYRALTGDGGPECENDPRTLLVDVGAPPLCPGCRRLFIDFSVIPPNDPGSGLFYAHGHVYFRMHSFNPTYTADPIAHSPNIKNVTNDKAVAPAGSVQEQLATWFDTYAIAYVGDTARVHHNAIQGPYYIGPAYVNAAGRTILGAYVDVDVASAQDMRNPALNGIAYWAGFDSGEQTCPHNSSEEYADTDAFYFGCTPHPGTSIAVVDPFTT
ncbi:MAG: hypothetical protein ACRDJM_05600 [Actinomycetota bacterium]